MRNNRAFPGPSGPASCRVPRGLFKLSMALVLGTASAPIWAKGPLGPYVGLGVGQSQLALDQFPAGAANPTDFSAHATGWKAVVGLRPVRWIGAELEYVDLGHSTMLLSGAVSATRSGVPASVKADGPALFAVAYLPVALFDFYGKVGVSRLHTSGDAASIGIVGVDICYFSPSALGCRSFHDDRQINGLSWGGGVQLTLSAMGVRAEYERFGSGSVRPSLASLVLTWSF
jgi:hypothetical protein